MIEKFSNFQENDKLIDPRNSRHPRQKTKSHHNHSDKEGNSPENKDMLPTQGKDKNDNKLLVGNNGNKKVLNQHL